MKIIVIEGADNLGKSTIIHKLMEQYESVLYVHCQKPSTNDPIYAAIEQKETFNKLIEKYIIQQQNNNTEPDICIFDRSWVGEYVYGTLYRHNSTEFVTDMIVDINRRLNEYCKQLNNKVTSRKCEIYYILLVPWGAEFCLKKDDGKSLSNKSIEKIEKELDLFNEAFLRMQTNKENDHLNYINIKHIVVEDFSNLGNFRDINEIMAEVNEFVNL